MHVATLVAGLVAGTVVAAEAQAIGMIELNPGGAPASGSLSLGLGRGVKFTLNKPITANTVGIYADLYVPEDSFATTAYHIELRKHGLLTSTLLEQFSFTTNDDTLDWDDFQFNTADTNMLLDEGTYSLVIRPQTLLKRLPRRENLPLYNIAGPTSVANGDATLLGSVIFLSLDPLDLLGTDAAPLFRIATLPEPTVLGLGVLGTVLAWRRRPA